MADTAQRPAEARCADGTDRPAPLGPNLFVVGAMKSGTTTLAAYLDRHPSISVSSPKEPCYFVDPAILRAHWPTMWARRYWADAEAYRALFRAGPAVRYWCDASTLYAKLPDIPGVADRIRAAAPDARILYVMRDPVDRAASHYWHAYRTGEETRSMAEAIGSRESPYLNYGRYAMQLAPYLEAFGRPRIYPIVFETLVAEPNATLNALFRWLGLDPLSDDTGPALKSHEGPRVAENPALQNRLYRALKADTLNPFKRFVPAPIKTALKVRLGGAAYSDHAMPAELAQTVRAALKPDRRRLAADLGVNPAAWGGPDAAP